MNATRSQKIVGHFGTYGKWVTQSLAPIVDSLLVRSDDVHLHLIGGRSDQFREKLVAKNSSWAARISATGRLDSEEVADHIAACDVMLQPYPDGANTRRTSLMACLINARATVTTQGANCEAVWSESGIVRLSDGTNPESAVQQILELLMDKATRDLLGDFAYAYYISHFAMESTLDVLSRN